ncbi:MAG TPA: zinc ABC transporter substrate-binding protein [Oscillospiraceae bacterium]|nr:zinc ABC transporter substrate-binding protein [Oscillospiraceae bacterium]HPF56487.1 zinc ABC transporter substrate-binding protein [Clostridiales bacterium]HPK35260.1 zinc ABC transporter substrate-binding protein [Oscillospiraceae bacterium]HPR75453.1 zinc ABC transporter substrate-binding protein [Oscillospiraceae bacterium]
MSSHPFKPALFIALLFSSLLLFSACSGTSSSVPEQAGKPIIAVSIVPEATFVQAVCGELADVVTLIPPGGSPENYEPTPDIMAQFEKASLYFSIGVPTESANILPNVADTVKVVSLADEVAAAYPDRTFESGERDPHIWLSPKRVRVMVSAITREMSTLDPDNAAIYAQNANAYLAQLDEVDTQIKTALDGVQVKKFIVYHPAFGYLADDYGLTMYALEEEGKEATAQHLQAVIDMAKAENIKVIFYQSEIDSSQSESFAEEIGGRTIQLEPLSADYINNLKAMANLMAEVMQ